jgi:transposase
MVWGCIMHGAKGPLVVLEYPGGKGGGMDSNRYREQVLEGVLLEFYEEMKKKKWVVYFQQDGAPSHTSKATKKWCEDHKIKLFPHPPSSPDVNPIEPVWHEIKTMIRHLPHPPSTVNQLKAAVRKAWDDLTIEQITKYTGTMVDRVQAVKKARGGHTIY